VVAYFRDDLPKVDVPTLVIHGDSDVIVPFEVSGRRTAEATRAARPGGEGWAPTAST
jgi:pimeloyl-ACP methyl ester carboxylesterase